MGPALSVEIWESMKASDSLRYLDPGLLSDIAGAYRYIEQTRILEDVWTRKYGDPVELGQPESAAMIKRDDTALAAVRRAISCIEQVDLELADASVEEDFAPRA